MDVREKLVGLQSIITCPNDICNFCEHFKNKDACEKHKKEVIADNMIAHGVTVQEWYSASNPPKEDGTYLVQTNTGTITTARFYAFKSFPATKYLPACHRSPSWQSNRNVVKWTFLPQPPKGE